MSDENNIESIYRAQKATRPKIEDVAGDFLDAGRTAALLNLAAYIRDNKINIQWASGNSWALNVKNKRLGYLKICDGSPAQIYRGSWYFCHNRAYLDNYYSMADSDFKTFIFENIYARNCGSCTVSSKRPDEKKAGYMTPTDCWCWPFRIFNPEGEALEYVKKLIEYRKNCILEEMK